VSALREFDKITKRLLSRVITIYTENGWDRFQWVSSAKVRGNIVSLKFHDDLKPYLLELKKSGNFTQHRLGAIIWFKSVYSSRIYQLLKEYYSKRMYTFEFSLDHFREMMLGEDSNSYPLYKNFRKYILDVAKRELESKDPETGFFKSDLSFDLETRRTGRKISHLKFIIKKQKTKPIKQIKIESPEEPENPFLDTPEYKGMEAIGITEKYAIAFFDQYKPEYIAEKLQVLTERQQIEDVISPSGFFIRALEKDYKSEKFAQQAKDAERRAIEEKKRQLERVERRKNELDIEHGKIAKKEFLESLNQEEEDKLLDEIKTLHSGNKWVLDGIKQDGLSSMMIVMNVIDKIPNYKKHKETYINKKIKGEFNINT
jgi:plasmid replication initiation protein